MIATIITIGDEILIGQIVDTNSAWMARELNRVGVSVLEIMSISDDEDHIVSAFAKAEQQSDIVLVTGGLGPTKDDVTKTALCTYFQDELVLDEATLQHVKDLFAKYVKDKLLPANETQAMLPSKATILKNEYGTAPGMLLVNNDTTFVSMPGVPFEMKALMINHVIPYIVEKGELPYIYHRTILTAGQGESTIAHRIEQWENLLPSHVSLAYLPSLGSVRLRLSCKGMDKEQVTRDVDAQVDQLYGLLADIIVGESNDETLSQQISALFKSQEKTLAVAESCTGGQIAQQLTQHPGASQFFKGASVTYATQSKVDLLDVDQALIDKYSVVSEEVAIAMAIGARKKFKADVAVSTTGNAGPDKGDSDVAVGTVCIGIATGDQQYALKFMMGNHRERVIQKTVNKSMELLQKELLKKAVI
ncbi:CinA family nicotinamide mononucleotide deamidase-related protein [Nonlabens ponticola]|uniref:CinA-like protein n=1 Tax=Nonlabens ponticola TaxID=2496866 RepID=A0A3S9MXH6_9FLAO|nr:CinA family nicotinamide mononucleotide deamidase-related protein [Nonlabens ponticola]AZQ43847.1 CinA family nicotinamide mononucleotide deamidase-related protein [Nonlabens ponticola]